MKQEFKMKGPDPLFNPSLPLLVIVVSVAYTGGIKGIGDYEVLFMRAMGYNIPELSK